MYKSDKISVELPVKMRTGVQFGGQQHKSIVGGGTKRGSCQLFRFSAPKESFEGGSVFSKGRRSFPPYSSVTLS